MFCVLKNVAPNRLYNLSFIFSYERDQKTLNHFRYSKENMILFIFFILGFVLFTVTVREDEIFFDKNLKLFNLDNDTK